MMPARCPVSGVRIERQPGEGEGRQGGRRWVSPELSRAMSPELCPLLGVWGGLPFSSPWRGRGAVGARPFGGVVEMRLVTARVIRRVA